jgi:putative acetyltransferase
MPAQERSLSIRAELEHDAAGIHAVNVAAFGQDAEARIVDAIRRDGVMTCSLVADGPSGIVGHILFTPVALPDDDQSGAVRIVGLAPMAVHPDRQREGIGSALVHAGLRACADNGVKAVVVLGHPDFYPRFGFRRASAFGLTCEFPVPDEVFMALELVEGALSRRRGLVRYLPIFSA